MAEAIDNLIDILSKLLEDIIIDAISQLKIGNQIFNIQLNYREIDNYWPYITFIENEQKLKAEINETEELFLMSSPILNAELLNYSSGKIEKIYTEFDEYVQSNQAWNKGLEMLIKISKSLTEKKLKLSAPTSNDFIVFPVDWSMILESDEIEDILTKYGADKKDVQKWKELNWF